MEVARDSFRKNVISLPNFKTVSVSITGFFRNSSRTYARDLGIPLRISPLIHYGNLYTNASSFCMNALNESFIDLYSKILTGIPPRTFPGNPPEFAPGILQAIFPDIPPEILPETPPRIFPAGLQGFIFRDYTRILGLLQPGFFRVISPVIQPWIPPKVLIGIFQVAFPEICSGPPRIPLEIPSAIPS